MAEVCDGGGGGVEGVEVSEDHAWLPSLHWQSLYKAGNFLQSGADALHGDLLVDAIECILPPYCSGPAALPFGLYQLAAGFYDGGMNRGK